MSSLNRRQFLASLAATGFAQQRDKPNVIFVLADDLGYRDLGYLGGEMATPNLDRLARYGVRLDQHYAFPVCSPTRSGIMTGRNPIRLGLGYTIVRPWQERGLPENETTMGEVFRAGGYRTAILGKWHLGHHRAPQVPNARGFDHFYGHVNGAIDYFKHERDGGLDWQRNGKSLREEGYSTDLLAAEAVRWIGPKGPKDPFFLYLPFNAPHGPLQAPERLLAKHAGIADGKRRAYVAMVEALDEAVGKLVAHLEDTGRMKNTLIAFQSDNGGPLNQGANNGSLRDAKGTVYEGGIRVPAFLHWPGKLASRGTKSVTTLCDWLPTLAAAAGIPAKTRQPMDGMNLWPALSGQRELPERENLFFSIMTGKNAPHYALREGRFKLIRLGGKEELYDVESDPAEKNNLLPEREADARPLREKMNAWAALAPADSPTPSTAAPAGFRSPADWASLAQRP